MIGDPSGKSQERNLLDEKTLRHNQEAIKRQLANCSTSSRTPRTPHRWSTTTTGWKEFSFLDFIRDIGKCITVNYMMAKDSVKKRFNGEGDGMSFTEFTYQLVQGYDFLHLYQTKNCKIQLGGADQWGNITTGTELIRRKLGPEAEAFAITCPLITKADGTKFGKTERQRMARPALHLALQVLPVLAQRQRRGRQALHQDLHAARPRNHRGPHRRARRRSPICECSRSGWPRRSPA